MLKIVISLPADADYHLKQRTGYLTEMSNWTIIYSSNQLYKAELMKQLLAENDIQAFLVNKKDSAYLFGEVEVYVSVEDAFRARQIIIKSESE